MGPLTYFNHFFLGLIIGYLCRGKMLRLGEIPLRFGWFAVMLLAVRGIVSSASFQNSVPNVETVSSVAFVLLLVGMMGMLWFNLHIAGVPLIALGISMNLVVLVANGGYMPVSLRALERINAVDMAGHLAAGERIMHSVAMTDSSRLPWLADWVIVPAVLSIMAVASPGDVLIGTGFTYLLVCGMIGRPNGLRGPRLEEPVETSPQPAAA